MARLIFVHLVLRLCGISSVLIIYPLGYKLDKVPKAVLVRFASNKYIMMLIAHENRNIQYHTLASLAIPVLHQLISADVYI